MPGYWDSRTLELRNLGLRILGMRRMSLFLRCCWPGERTQVTNAARRKRSTFTSKSGPSPAVAAAVDVAALAAPRTIASSDVCRGADYPICICILFVVAWLRAPQLRLQLLSTILSCHVRPPLSSPPLGPWRCLPFSVVLTHSVNITPTMRGSKSMLPLRKEKPSAGKLWGVDESRRPYLAWLRVAKPQSFHRRVIYWQRAPTSHVLYLTKKKYF